MLAKSNVLCLTAGVTAAFAARIPMGHSCGTITVAEHMHHAGDLEIMKYLKLNFPRSPGPVHRERHGFDHKGVCLCPSFLDSFI
jgi:hypothetical protein